MMWQGGSGGVTSFLMRLDKKLFHRQRTFLSFYHREKNSRPLISISSDILGDLNDAGEFCSMFVVLCHRCNLCLGTLPCYSIINCALPCVTRLIDSKHQESPSSPSARYEAYLVRECFSFSSHCSFCLSLCSFCLSPCPSLVSLSF